MRKPSFFIGFGLVLALMACGDQGRLPSAAATFKNTDVTGVDYGRDFALTDHTGKVRTLRDFRGKAVVMFFGYTQCPDVCPTTLFEMVHVMKILGPLANKVQVLLVTLDPERDTVQHLSEYVPAFDPRFLGLVGNLAATQRVAQEFKVFYQKVPGKHPGSYTIDHTAGSYIFDPQGRLRLFVRYGQDAQAIAQDLKVLLS